MGTSIREFAEEMSVVMPRLLREFLKRQPAAVITGTISVPQMAILHSLIEMKQCKMTDIAKLLYVTTSAATGIVDRMVKSGLLMRVPDTGDRRVVNIQITPKGKKTMNNIFTQRQKMMIAIFKNFTPEEREIYLNMVKKIHTLLSKGIGCHETRSSL
jgi:DNA-binding MarR family transcriptional regulator